MILSNISAAILFGFIFIAFKVFQIRKLPSLKQFIILFLAGGSFYGGVSALYFGLLGSFFLNDTAETMRVTTSLGGIVLMYFCFELVFKEDNQEGVSTPSPSQGVKTEQKGKEKEKIH